MLHAVLVGACCWPAQWQRCCWQCYRAQMSQLDHKLPCATAAAAAAAPCCALGCLLLASSIAMRLLVSSHAGRALTRTRLPALALAAASKSACSSSCDACALSVCVTHLTKEVSPPTHTVQKAMHNAPHLCFRPRVAWLTADVDHAHHARKECVFIQHMCKNAIMWFYRNTITHNGCPGRLTCALGPALRGSRPMLMTRTTTAPREMMVGVSGAPLAGGGCVCACVCVCARTCACGG